MSLIDLLLSEKETCRPAVFVITPTEEWKGFALQHGMSSIKMCVDSTPINFFRCPPNIEAEQFYGNLAMILASASNAGPYQNPIEKCMLNAFKRAYSENRTPDPSSIYDEIERSIVRYHGSRTNVGIKYTKHGENIKSSLEDLRNILSMPQYCIKDGIRIEDLLERGVVFDLSSASVGARRHLYALILNQIYALTSGYDANGDDELRLLICIEEAQTIFGSIESPAVRDIKQRIQDFRKQGIGIMLLTHNVSDIEVGIRRLCQIKLYMKQAADTAKLAAQDLIFGGVEQDDVVLKLKLLDSGIGALSYVIKRGREKEQQETIFIRTNSYDIQAVGNANNPIDDYISKLGLKVAAPAKCRLHLTFGNGIDVSPASLKEKYEVCIFYLGDEIKRVELEKLGSLDILLFHGKNYIIKLQNRKGRTLKQFDVIAAEEIYLDIGES